MKLKRIWLAGADGKDVYVDFKGQFVAEVNAKTVIYLSCDSIFAFYLNDKLVGFGSCSDYPFKNLYYTFDVSDKIAERNDLKITVWHQGEDTQTYINQEAYLAFKIVSGGKTILSSDKTIKCALNDEYISGVCKKITHQLGYGFAYRKSVGPQEEVFAEEYGEEEFFDNEIKNLVLKDRVKTSVVKTDSGYMIDLGGEVVGFADIDIECDKTQALIFSYGERLCNEKVPRLIGDRDFSFTVNAAKGKTSFLNPFRRIACRYIEVDCKGVKINYVGVRPTVYPVEKIPHKFSDETVQKIYDVAVYTLLCCMHEHYEDCPWREQALYTMDSRNQMLCGYYAFKNYEFQRANLILISQGLRKDGVLSICFPSGIDKPIPFFSLVYPLQVYEYIKHTKDESILCIVGDCIKKMMTTFDNAVEENGLIPNFPYPFWNFYEWNGYSSNESEISRSSSEPYKKEYHLILNCFYVYIKQTCAKLFKTEYDLSKTKLAIKKTFYDEKEGLFKLADDKNTFDVLGNSLSILCGIGDDGIAEKLKTKKDLAEITLSMKTFFYDALLKVDEKNGKYIIDDIKRTYKRMLDSGATTFWETEKGGEDFGNAGSLCHGWSAIPVYYFERLKKFL